MRKLDIEQVLRGPCAEYKHGKIWGTGSYSQRLRGGLPEEVVLKE